MSKPFRFGVQSFNAESGEAWAGQARRAEELGYSAFHLADHLIGPGPALERSNHPIQNLAAIPAMAYAAAVTSTIHIGCRVFCIDYHNPVVLVKSAMTIDMLSGGRLEFGARRGLAEGRVRGHWPAPRSAGAAHRPACRRHRGRQGLPWGRARRRRQRHAELERIRGLAETGLQAAHHGRRRQPQGIAAGGSGSRHRQPQFQQPGRHHRAGWRADVHRGGNPQETALDSRRRGRAVRRPRNRDRRLFHLRRGRPVTGARGVRADVRSRRGGNGAPPPHARRRCRCDLR